MKQYFQGLAADRVQTPKGLLKTESADFYITSKLYQPPRDSKEAAEQPMDTEEDRTLGWPQPSKGALIPSHHPSRYNLTGRQ